MKTSKWESEESVAYKHLAARLYKRTTDMSQWEIEFLENILNTQCDLSEPQMQIIEELGEEYL